MRIAEDVAGALSVSVTFTLRVTPPPVSVMIALFVPTVAVLVFMLAVTLPLLELDVGFTDNQLALSLTVHDVLDVTEKV